MIEPVIFAFFAFLILIAVFFATFQSLLSPEKSRDVNENLQILRSQFKELENQKSLGFLTESEFLESKADLEKRVLEESTAPQNATATFKPAPKTAWFLLLALPIASLSLYFVWGNPNALSLEQRDPITFGQKNFIADLRENPQNATALANLFTLAVELQNAGENARALSVLEDFQKLGIENADFLSLYASALWGQNGTFLGEPLAMLERAISLDSENPRALLFLGFALIEKGDFKTARETLEKAKTKNDDPRVIAMIDNTLADLKIRLGETVAGDEALAVAQLIDLKDKILAQKNSPEFQQGAPILLILAKAAHNLRRYDLALEMFAAAESFIPKNDAEMQAIFAGTLWRTGDKAKAESLLESAKNADSQNQWVIFYTAFFAGNAELLKTLTITEQTPLYLRYEIENFKNPR